MSFSDKSMTILGGLVVPSYYSRLQVYPEKSIPSRTKITKSPDCSSFYCPSCEFPPYQELFICQFSRGVGLLIHSFPGGRVCFSKRVVVPAQVGDDRS